MTFFKKYARARRKRNLIENLTRLMSMSKDIEDIKKRFPLPENPQQALRDSSKQEVKDNTVLPRLPQLIRLQTSEDLREPPTEQSHEEIAAYIAKQLVKIREELAGYSKEKLEQIVGSAYSLQRERAKRKKMEPLFTKTSGKRIGGVCIRG